VTRVPAERRVGRAEALDGFPDDDDPIDVLVGEGPQHDVVDEREDHCRRAEAEGQGQDCGSREARRLPQAAGGELHIGQQRFQAFTHASRSSLMMIQALGHQR
jgi:hypothetical protein